MKAILKSALVSLTLMASAGCTAAQNQPSAKKAEPESHKTKAHHTHDSFRKPSAAIYFNHKFAGSADVGTTQTIELQVRDQYPGATISYEVQPSPGISLFGPAQFSSSSSSIEGLNQATADFGELPDNNFTLNFQPTQEGVHNISIVATVQMTNGQSIVSSHTIPVYVGDDYQPTKQSLKDQMAKKQESVVSDGLIIMEAEETID